MVKHNRSTSDEFLEHKVSFHHTVDSLFSLLYGAPTFAERIRHILLRSLSSDTPISKDVQHHSSTDHIDFKGSHGWRSERVLAYYQHPSRLFQFSMTTTRPRVWPWGLGGQLGSDFSFYCTLEAPTSASCFVRVQNIGI